MEANRNGRSPNKPNRQPFTGDCTFAQCPGQLPGGAFAQQPLCNVSKLIFVWFFLILKYNQLNYGPQLDEEPKHSLAHDHLCIHQPMNFFGSNLAVR